MDSKQYTDYKVLRLIEQRNNLSQRSISKQTGINLSSVNYALKRLIKKGYVTITRIENKKKLLYHLTPSGIACKGRLAYEFFLYNYSFFSDIQELVNGHLENYDLAGKNLAIFGFNEMTEIIYLCLKNKGYNFIGVFENSPDLIGRSCPEGQVQAVDTVEQNMAIHYFIDSKGTKDKLTGLEVLPKQQFIEKNR